MFEGLHILSSHYTKHSHSDPGRSHLTGAHLETSHNQNFTISFILCCAARIHIICEEFKPLLKKTKITGRTFNKNRHAELSYQADHERLLGFISDRRQHRFLFVTPHEGRVKVHDICVIIVITDAIVLPPARVRAALRG